LISLAKELNFSCPFRAATAQVPMRRKERSLMTIVVTDNCELCRFTECVSVCPVACFHADDKMVYIDNDVCIDCRACIPVCPVKAIFAEEDLTGSQLHWVAENAEKSRQLPVVSEKQSPLPTAEARRAALGY
jgi:ferredoxin